MKTLHLITLHNSLTNIMSSPSTSMSKSSKRQKIVIIPPKHLIIDLTQDDNTTPSPPPQCSSPSAPNAPSKTPSTHGTSSSSIPSTSSINDYINSHLSPLVSPSHPTHEPLSTDLTISLSPITPLDAHFSSSPIPPPLFVNPIPWSLLEAHGDTCLCCIHNRTIIFGLRDELQYMFSCIEYLLNNPPQPPPQISTPNFPTPPPTSPISPPSPSSSPN